MVKIKFLGAAETVTGSSFLVNSENVKFLVDSGMFQGEDVVNRNALPYSFSPEEINFVLITHAHLDHIGLLPKLIKYGFRGSIYMTPATSAIAYHLLLDSAKIQENESMRGRRDGKVNSSFLYDTTDALDAISRFRNIQFDEEVNISGVKIKFIRAGHALGAASIICELEGKRIIFSGDIGRREHPFLEGFDQTEKEADFIIMEALYGGQEHEQRKQTERGLLETVNKILQRDGNVIIPVFALQRTQEILNVLKKGYQDNIISKGTRVSLDSPLAQKITNIYSQNIFKENLLGKELFDFDELRFIKNKKRATMKKKLHGIILAGSGMCEGGKILGHLARNLPNSNNGILIVGFQAEGTLGRSLIEGSKNVIINHKEVSVRAEIFTFFGFSAHGDRHDLHSWLKNFQKEKLKRIFLVHGEREKMELFMKDEDISDKAEIPKWNEEIVLD